MRRLLTSALATALLSAIVPAAAGAPGNARPIVIVADTRSLTGWQAWWGNLYNESHAYFTLLTIILVPAVAVVFGLVTDLAMARMGINLRSRSLVEH